MTADEAWRDLAHGSREALAQLGYDIGPHCLPGEPGACGGGFAQHAVAHLAALRAVADHHLDHLGIPRQVVTRIYEEITQAIDCEVTCRAGG